MKATKRTIIVGTLAVVAVGVAIGLLVFWNPFTINRRLEITGAGGTPTTIEGLSEAIAKYDAKVQEIIRASAQEGAFWKLLSVRYMEKNMHGPALEALKEAVKFYPTDAGLQYMTGLSASIMAKSAVEYGSAASRSRERDRLFALAESSHKRAIALDPKYARSMYALGVLLVFELDRPAEAIPYLEKALTLQTKDFAVMFVLARAYYMTNRRDDAVKLYDRIISKTKDETMRSEATANKRTVLDQQYGAR